MPFKKEKDFTNEEIIIGIKEENPEIFRFIQFKTYSTIQNIVKQFKGEKPEVNEVFQDALIVVFKKLKKGELQLTCAFTTYFIGICKTILKFSHRKGNTVILNLVDAVEDEEEIEELYKESKEFQLYKKHFVKLKERQQEILLASLSNNPYNELFIYFGYKNTDVFKTEVYRIKKRLIKYITSDPEFKKINGGKNWSL